MISPVFGAHFSSIEFLYPDLTWQETCGMMANLVAESEGNKGQLSHLVEEICRDSGVRNVKVSWLKYLRKKDIKSIGKAVQMVSEELNIEYSCVFCETSDEKTHLLTFVS